MRTCVMEGPQLEGLELLLGRLGPELEAARHLPATSGVSRVVLKGVSLHEIAIGDRIVLSDPDATPLATIEVGLAVVGESGGVEVEGTLERLRAPEHGPARADRFPPNTDLANSTVALFSTAWSARDIRSAIRSAGAGALELVACGGEEYASALELLEQLKLIASLRPQTSVHFLPVADLGSRVNDPAKLALASMGATNVLDYRREDIARRGGLVILFTGLSGSGKSTLARAVYDRVVTWRPCVLLDGDHVRRELSGDLGYSIADRQRNLERQAWVAARVAEGGAIAICAPIAPLASMRAAMRSRIESTSPLVLIHVSTPLEVAEARDRKGLYARARAGELKDFTGIDAPYETPIDADATVDMSSLSVEQGVEIVAETLRRRGLD